MDRHVPRLPISILSICIKLHVNITSAFIFMYVGLEQFHVYLPEFHDYLLM